MVNKFRIQRLLGIAAFLLFIGCSEQQEQVVIDTETVEVLDSAKWVINESIWRHGGDFEEKLVEFDFRDKHYTANFNSNKTYMIRSYSKNDSIYIDSTDGVKTFRTINGELVDVSNKKSQGITNSINSVFYFALLPSKLSDPAVVTDYKGIVKVKSGTYYQIAVEFKQEGGGEDFQDKFFYWFNVETFHLSYLAYSYETSNGGIRFRSVEKQQNLPNGYLFQDYVNYKTDSLSTKLQDLLALHVDSQLVELSRIRLENVAVK